MDILPTLFVTMSSVIFCSFPPFLSLPGYTRNKLKASDQVIIAGCVFMSVMLERGKKLVQLALLQDSSAESPDNGKKTWKFMILI